MATTPDARLDAVFSNIDEDMHAVVKEELAAGRYSVEDLEQAHEIRRRSSEKLKEIGKAHMMGNTSRCKSLRNQMHELIYEEMQNKAIRYRMRAGLATIPDKEAASTMTELYGYGRDDLKTAPQKKTNSDAETTEIGEERTEEMKDAILQLHQELKDAISESKPTDELFDRLQKATLRLVNRTRRLDNIADKTKPNGLRKKIRELEATVREQEEAMKCQYKDTAELTALKEEHEQLTRDYNALDKEMGRLRAALQIFIG